MSLPTPNYVTIEEHRLYFGIQSDKTMPAGSFVRPIDDRYLPEHIKQAREYQWYDPEREVFVYSHYGIVCIPKAKIRRT